MGLFDTMTRLTASSGVVAYHGITEDGFNRTIHVTDDVLDEHLSFLVHNFNVVSLQEFVRRRKAGRTTKSCVAITFDDAYKGIVDTGMPIFERYQVPITVFVASGFTNAGARYWWDRTEFVRTRGSQQHHRTLLSAAGVESFQELGQAIKLETSGRVPDRVINALNTIEAEIGLVPVRPISENEFAPLAASSLVEFGCHTATHPALPGMPVGEQVREIRTCREWLMQRLPRVRNFLAYPYGMWDRASVSAAISSGIEASFTMKGWATTDRFDLHRCPRIGLSADATVQTISLRTQRRAIPALMIRGRISM